MDANEAKKRYSRYNKRVKEYMGFVIDELFDKYLDIQESFVISLDLLAVNIEIFYDSLKEIREAGVTANDQRTEEECGDRYVIQCARSRS